VLYPIEPRSYRARRLGVVDLRSHSETVSVLGSGEGTEWLWAAQFSLADDWPRVYLLGRLAGRRHVDRRRRETPRNRVGTRDFAGLRSQLLKLGLSCRGSDLRSPNCRSAFAIHSVHKIGSYLQFSPVRLFALKRCKQNLTELQEIGFAGRG
jgi:hypothetical protein